MSNEARHNHVSIDLKEMRESGIELKEESIIHQEQLDKVCEIIRRRLDDGKDYDPDEKFMSINDVISIFARRGAGKTTFVKTLIDLAKNNKLANRETNAIKSNELLCIDVIEPNQIYRKENFMLRFLASIQEKFDSEVEYYEKEKSRLRTLKEELYEALPVINGIGKLSLYTDWDDSDYVADKYIKFATKAKDLEQRFHRYIHKMMELSGRKALLFVLDDSDVNIERTFDILETIRLFFTSPQIIVIMTGDLSLYSMAIRRRYWEFFDKEYIEKDGSLTLQDDLKKKEYFDMVRQLEAQYLQKLIKAEHRIVLNTVFDKYSKTKDEENEEDKYSIEITLSNGDKHELREVYQKILEGVNVVPMGSDSDDEQIFVNHLLKQPFRNQYQLLSAYDEYHSTHKTTDEGLSSGTVDLAESILKVFEVYINQSSPDSKMLMGRSPIYSGWLMKFLIDNNIATTASHLLPTIEDNTLNSAIFALNVWCKSQMQSNKSIIFDYLVRVSFMRQILNTLNESGEKLYNFVGICRDIDVHKILGGAHAYFNARTKEVNQNVISSVSPYPFAGIFARTSHVSPQTNGIEGNLVNLIQLESISAEARTCICSFYKLITSLAELLKEYESKQLIAERKVGQKSNDWIRTKLDNISQYHTYIEPCENKNHYEDVDEKRYESKKMKEVDAKRQSKFVEDFSEWMKKIQNVWTTPQSIDRVFTRSYFNFREIDSTFVYDPQNLGERFSNYVLAFWNACIVEESIIFNNPKDITLNYESSIVKIFLKNYTKFIYATKDTSNSFAYSLMACPLLRAYVNPQVLVIVDELKQMVKKPRYKFAITIEDFISLRNNDIKEDIDACIEILTRRINRIKDEIGTCQKHLLEWIEFKNMCKKKEELEMLILNSSVDEKTQYIPALVTEYNNVDKRIKKDVPKLPKSEDALNKQLDELYSELESVSKLHETYISLKELHNDEVTEPSDIETIKKKLDEAIEKMQELSVYNELKKCQTLL